MFVCIMEKILNSVIMASYSKSFM